jgi:hypothetical protein
MALVRTNSTSEFEIANESLVITIQENSDVVLQRVSTPAIYAVATAMTATHAPAYFSEALLASI